jgi:DNA-binding transcriptional MerR regulator
MASVRSFHKHRGEKSFTLPRLLEILREQLPLVASRQTKYKVTEIPTARTIRFYTSRGLVDKPAARDGVNALYGYRHLLQVLAIKYLQSQYLPLVKIRSLVENADNRELELLIPAVAPAMAASRGIARDNARVTAPTFLPQASVGVRSLQPGTETPPDAVSGLPDTWHRVDIGPGIELHVHASALSLESRERLRGALLRELGVLRGWFGEEKH